MSRSVVRAAVTRRRIQTPAYRLLRRWQDVAAARHHCEDVDADALRREVRWAFEHHFPSTASVDSDRLRRAAFTEACLALVRGQPLAYALRSTPFADLPVDLAIEPPILIPRPETEEWSTRLAQRIQDHIERHQNDPLDVRILDLCTGSGCIAVLLAHRLQALSRRLPPDRLVFQVSGIDVSSAAISLAQRNAARLRLDHGVLQFRQADLFSETAMDTLFESTFQLTRNPRTEASNVRESRRVHIVISNPPYITPQAYQESLPSSVRDWEDPRALVGIHPAETIDSTMKTAAAASADDAAGLTFYRRIANLCARHSLRLFSTCCTQAARRDEAAPNIPHVVLEVGQGQAEAVADIFQSTFPVPAQVAVRADSWGVDRVVEVTVSNEHRMSS